MGRFKRRRTEPEPTPGPAAAATAVFEQALAKLDEPGLKRLNKTLLHQIDLMTGRIEYAESRRGAIATFASALFAGGVALFALPIDASWSPFPHPFAVRLFGLALMVFAAVTLIAWARQINPPYGFNEPGGPRPWKWFYRDALTDFEVFTLRWWWPIGRQQAPITAFREQWDPFAQRSLGLADLRTDALQNLQQVYLMHVNERYKNFFLSQLRSLLLFTVSISFVIFLVAAITLALIIPSAPAPSTAPPSSASSAPVASALPSAAPVPIATAAPTPIPAPVTPSSSP